ncbi:unnamed protein product [Sympodiomycopsis kandeliae]
MAFLVTLLLFMPDSHAGDPEQHRRRVVDSSPANAYVLRSLSIPSAQYYSPARRHAKRGGCIGKCATDPVAHSPQASGRINQQTSRPSRTQSSAIQSSVLIDSPVSRIRTPPVGSPSSPQYHQMTLDRLIHTSSASSSRSQNGQSPAPSHGGTSSASKSHTSSVSPSVIGSPNGSPQWLHVEH